MTARLQPVVLPGLALLVLLVAAFGAPLFAPFDPTAMDVIGRNKPPSAEHWLGQDNFGRDIFSRLLYGARVSLTVAIVSAAIAMVIGVTLGLIGGYFRGLSEILTLRLVDIILSFPPILLALLVVTLFGPGMLTLTACLSILFAPGFARVTYGEVLSVRKLDYVEATRALGAGSSRIVLGTVLPNVAAPIIVQVSLTIASAVLIESGLSFLGLGVVPPAPSWGLMIREARGTMAYTALPLIWPCLALIVTVLIFNALCDGLRDVFDPKRKSRISAPPAPIPFSPSQPDDDLDTVLKVSNLSTRISTPNGVVPAVDEVSFTLKRGETLAIVGESGSGKSMTGLSLMGLHPADTGRIVAGNIWLRTRSGDVLDVAVADPARLQAIRGDEIAMIFQEPMTALNPVYRIGDQIVEAVLQHRDIGPDKAWALAVEALDKVGVPEPALRAKAYPHELSGGLRQRAMIAMALVLEPSILIADEPTTALDVTIQAQILALLQALLQDSAARPAMIFITHDLGVVAEIADRVMVFYAGKVVEEGAVDEVFANPRHPYTRGLLDSAPVPGSEGRLRAIEGTVPNPLNLPPGCAFAPRCAFRQPRCEVERPDLIQVGPGRNRCHFWETIP